MFIKIEKQKHKTTILLKYRFIFFIFLVFKKSPDQHTGSFLLVRNLIDPNALCHPDHYLCCLQFTVQLSIPSIRITFKIKDQLSPAIVDPEIFKLFHSYRNWFQIIIQSVLVWSKS